MSNEMEDQLEYFKNSPINSKEHNRWLCYKYHWLIPHNRYTDEELLNYDYTYTELDEMPEGWKKAFGEQLCEEIEKLLEEVNYQDKYRITQIKEKYGELCWYDNGVPKQIYDRFLEIIHKYEKLSHKTCIKCGKPATKISTGWITPWCDDCAKSIHDNFIDIK